MLPLSAYPAGKIGCEEARCEYSHCAETPAQREQVYRPLVSNHLEDQE